MTRKQKSGCLFAIIGILVQLPLSWIMSYLIMRHIGATDAMWVLWWINLPLTIVMTFGVRAAEVIFAEEK